MIHISAGLRGNHPSLFRSWCLLRSANTPKYGPCWPLSRTPDSRVPTIASSELSSFDSGSIRGRESEEKPSRFVWRNALGSPDVAHVNELGGCRGPLCLGTPIRPPVRTLQTKQTASLYAGVFAGQKEKEEGHKGADSAHVPVMGMNWLSVWS